MAKVLKIFVAEGCGSCKEVAELAEKGKMLTNVAPETEIHLIDVTTDEGFPEVEAEQLNGVPVAKYEGRTCKLSIDEESHTLIIDCAQEKSKADRPASEPASPSPPAAPADSKPAAS